MDKYLTKHYQEKDDLTRIIHIGGGIFGFILLTCS